MKNSLMLHRQRDEISAANTSKFPAFKFAFLLLLLFKIGTSNASQDFSGKYHFLADFGKTVGSSSILVNYDLGISGDKCTLSVQGFQIADELLCSVRRVSDKKIEILFKSFADGSLDGGYPVQIYKVNELLFSLHRDGEKLFTEWGTLIAENPFAKKGIYFRQVSERSEVKDCDSSPSNFQKLPTDVLLGSDLAHINTFKLAPRLHSKFQSETGGAMIALEIQSHNDQYIIKRTYTEAGAAPMVTTWENICVNKQYIFGNNIRGKMTEDGLLWLELKSDIEFISPDIWVFLNKS